MKTKTTQKTKTTTKTTKKKKTKTKTATAIKTKKATKKTTTNTITSTTISIQTTSARIQYHYLGWVVVQFKVINAMIIVAVAVFGKKIF